MITWLSDRNFFKDTAVTGVYIDIGQNEQCFCHLVTLVKQKGKVEIVRKEKCELEKLSQTISPKEILFVCIDGKGILSREFKLQNLSDEELINIAFPNVKTADYYVQQITSSEEAILACFARKTTIDIIEKELCKQAFLILNISLGYLSVENFVLLHENSTIAATPYMVEIKNSQICRITKSEQIETTFTTIGNELILPEYALAFATALGFFANNNSGITTEQIQQNRKDNTYKRLIKKGGLFFLGFLFVVLLLNFVVFSCENQKKQTLVQELSQHQETIDRLNRYKKDIADKEQLLGSSSTNGSSYFAYYADRIAASKPQGIVLEAMNIFPVTMKNKKFVPEKTRRDTIIINGATQNSLLLNNWLKTLQKEKFARHVAIVNYTQQGGRGMFELVMVLKEE